MSDIAECRKQDEDVVLQKMFKDNNNNIYNKESV